MMPLGFEIRAWMGGEHINPRPMKLSVLYPYGLPPLMLREKDLDQRSIIANGTYYGEWEGTGMACTNKRRADVL